MRRNKIINWSIFTISLLVFFFCLVGLPDRAQAATYYWVGNEGGDVSNKANWNTAAAVCSGAGDAPSILTTDIFNFSSTCTSGASIGTDWSVSTLNINTGYTGTITGGAGVKLSVIAFTQTAGALNVTTLEHRRSNATWSINGGTRSIGTILVANGGASYGSIYVASGQTLSANTFQISGTGSGYINLPAAGTGTFTVGDLIFSPGSNVYLAAGYLTVTGNITTASSATNANTIGLTLSGTSTQSLDINNTLNLGGSLVVNKSGGEVILSGSSSGSIPTFTLSSGTFNVASTTVTFVGNLVVNSGTFSAGSGTTTVNGAVTLSGGTFNAGSANIYLRGHFTHNSAATFNPNTSTVYFSYTSATLTSNANGTTFNNLVVNLTNSWGSILTTTGGTITVNGNFSLVQGVMSGGTYNLKGPNVTLGPTGGNGSAATTDLLVNATSSQTVTVLSTMGTLPKLTINNGSAEVFYNGFATLNALTITAMSGSFDLGSYGLTVSNAFTISGGTFSAGSGTTTLTGAATLSGGTFNAGSGNIYLKGNFTHNSAATFNRDTSTVYFYYANASLTSNANGTTFNNLVVNLTNSWGNVLTTTGGTITVNGNFSIVQGVMSGGTYNLKGPNVTLGPTGGNGSAATTDLLVNGTGLQAVTVLNTMGVLPRLTMDNSLATVSYNGTANINRLTLNSMTGAFDIGANNFTSTLLTVNSGQTFSMAGSQTVTVTTATLNSGSTVEYTATSGSTPIKNWTYATLKINGSGGTFTLPANLTVANLDITAGTLSQGTYNITLGATGALTIGSDGMLYNNSTGDLTLGSGGLDNSGIVYLVSGGVVTDSTDSIAILSTTNGSAQRPWTGSGIFNLINTAVRDQGVSGGAAITVYYGTNTSNNGSNWTFTNSASPNKNWKGTTSNVWSVNSNWVEGSAPGPTEIAIFSSSYSNPASFDSSAVAPATIQISAGYNSTVTLAKDLSLTSYAQSSGVFNANSYGLTVSSSATLAGGTFTAGGGTHSFSSFTQSGGTFNGNSSATTFSGVFSQTSGTFNASTATTSFANNFSRTNGNFNGNGGIASFTGGNQTITGTTTFSNLSKIVSSAATLTFGAGQTTTITGTTTLKGVSGNLLSLRSSSSGNQWRFDPQGGRVFEYLDVKDSNNINESEINAADHVGLTDVNGVGTNPNWVFTIPVIYFSSAGGQVASTSLPVTNKYMGGAFVATSSVASTISEITLTQNGTLPTSNISSVSLYYKSAVADVCSYNVSGSTLFDSATVWTGQTIALTGSMNIGTTPTCIYIVFNLTGTFSIDLFSKIIDLEISNPSVDVVSSNASVSPATSVNIDGSTLVEGGSSGTPGITITVASSSISTGNSTTLSWTTTGFPTSCSASGDWSGTKGTTGTNVSTGILTEHRTYRFTLSCTNDNGSSAASVSVIAINPNAPIITISASPNSIDSGQSSTITWTTVGGINLPTSCTGTGGTGGWSGNKNVNGGSMPISNITSNTSFGLSCTNSYGTTVKTTGVSIKTEPVPSHCNNGKQDYDEEAEDWGGSCGYGQINGGSVSGGSIGDYITLIMPDEKDILFFFWNDGRQNSLKMRRDGGEVQKLTADNLNIVSGSFDKFDCFAGNDCRGLRVQMVVEKMSEPGTLQNYTIEKTFKTSVKVKKN